jgi:membrane-bound lytic murein transglycosylase D
MIASRRSLSLCSAALMLSAVCSFTARADEAFPRYPALEPVVAFWTDVFGRYSTQDSIVHAAEYPQVVLEVLHFPEDLPATVRRDREEAAKRKMKAALLRVHQHRQVPARLSGADRALFDRFQGIPGDDRFRKAADTLRAQRGIKERTGKALEIAGQYLPTMENTFRRYALPLKLTRLPLLESSFNVEAYSKVGAAGLWQFMPSSARIYMRLDDVIDDRRDPWTSTDGAARHLRDDYAMLGSWPLALTAYNHGRNGVARGLQAVKGVSLMDLIERYEHPRFGFASRNFYAEFLAVADIEAERARFFPDLQPRAPLAFDEVEVSHFVPFATLASLGGTDTQTLRQLNPAYSEAVYRGQLWVPKGHRLRLPAGTSPQFQQQYAMLSSDQRADRQRAYYRYHTVRKGEALGPIARRYGVTLSAVARTNNIADVSRIRIGQKLKIPPQAGAPSGLRKVSLRIHTVRSGQTLSAIARRYGVTVSALARQNNLDDRHMIHPGQRLKIPG